MQEGIAVGNRTVGPEEFRAHQETVNLAIDVLYQIGSLEGLTAKEFTLARAARHGLLELQELLREAQVEFEAQMRSLTR